MYSIIYPHDRLPTEGEQMSKQSKFEMHEDSMHAWHDIYESFNEMTFEQYTVNTFVRWYSMPKLENWLFAESL